MDATASTPPLPPLPEPAVIRETSREILQHSDYVLGPPSRSTEDILFKIVEILSRIFKALGQWGADLHGVSPVLFWLLVAGLILVLVGLVMHIAYSLHKAFARPDDATALRPQETESDEPALWEKRAREAQARGDFVYGLRCLLMAGLLRLEAGQKKRLRRGATNREILRRYRESAAFEPLKFMIDLVDLKWFGGVPCAGGDFDACAQAYAKLRATVPAAPPASAAAQRPAPPLAPGFGPGGRPRA